MPNSYSLHIGVNQVNPQHYDGWEGRLKYAEADAFAMQQIASSQEFEAQDLLLTKNATRKKVLAAIQRLAKKAKTGDLVWISYSGHGSFIPDINGDEANGMDETWCCYDGMVIDDELLYSWAQFRAGVRIVVVSDSCHSGEIARSLDAPAPDALVQRAKFLPIEKSLPIFQNNKAFYEGILAKIPTVDVDNLPVRVIQFGGCTEDSSSFEGKGNGEFTIALKTAWSDGTFKGDYAAFFTAIESHMDVRTQQPVLLSFGAEDAAFDGSKPFTTKAEKPKTEFQNAKYTEGVALLVDFGTEPIKGVKSAKHTQVHEYAAGNTSISIYQPKAKGVANAWDAAHALLKDFNAQGIQVRSIEPDYGMETHISDVPKQAKSGAAELFLTTWPHPEPERDTFDKLWHLNNDHSQLAAARDSILNDPIAMERIRQKPIRVAHLDTGYFPYQGFTPENIQRGLCKSFVDGEENNLAFDYFKDGFMPEEQGHGTATLALLAGPEVSSPKGLEGVEGYIGAVPFAEIVSIRVQDSVALLKTKAFEQAIYYAVEQGCEVVTMSMAGAPSQRWADAINYAYEKGVTVVSAAGNSWREGFKKHLPTYLLFPARFERVIGATGTTYSQQPYVFDANDWEEKQAKTAGGINMQGNHGPESQMNHIMAGYTPNVFWAITNQEDKEQSPHFIMTGGGTSSATPQVAAAAAIWIATHRDELEAKGYRGTWRQVEAVRKALFSTAVCGDNDFQYIGNGALKAHDALQKAPADALDLTKSPEAKIPFMPLFSTLFGLLAGAKDVTVAPVKVQMVALEFAQLVIAEPALQAYGAMDFQDDAVVSNLTEAQRQEIGGIVKAHPMASNALKSAFGG
jgi:subtilisin family serine protease